MKKRILIIHDSMHGGGAERVLATMLKNLDRNRIEPTLLLIYREGVFLKDIPGDVEVAGIFNNVKSFSSRLLNHFAPLRNRIRKSRALKLLKDRRFDTIVSYMEGPPVKLHSQLMHLAPDHCTWVHINLKLGRWYDFWITPREEAAFYSRVNRIAFVSESAKEAFGELFDTRAERRVIYNPIDTTSIKYAVENLPEEPHDRFRIVNVGRLVEQKRQDRLIRAAKILKEKGYRFEVETVGCGKLENDLKRLCAEEGVEDCVKFTGFSTQPYVRVKRADLFCLTSQTEGYPTVVAESLIIGTPVVATPVTGVTEMLSHGGGILTEPTPEAIAETIAALIDNPTRLKKLKDETAVSARQFDISTVMKRIENFISPQ